MEKNNSEILITETNLEEFKKLVKRAVFLKHDEEIIFNAIPNHTWKNIFVKNFSGNFEYARRSLLYKYKEIENIDTVVVDREKNKIFNLEKATNLVLKSIDNKDKILFITDFDNDGSLAQAVINEYLEVDKEAAKNIFVEYAQSVNGNTNRGFTVDHVDLIVESKNIDAKSNFLIITADNGINSKDEQEKILKKYPNAKIIVTDHHNPDPEMMVEDNDKTIIFNPKYKPTEFYKKYNISGATTVGVLMKEVLNKRTLNLDNNLNLNQYSKNIEKINTLFKVANLLDYVDSHPADKPEKDYIITKFLKLQPLLNINNSISKIITGEISTSAIQSLEKKIDKLDTTLLFEEAKNIHTQNTIAKILLEIYKKRKTYYNAANSTIQLNKDDFKKIFLEEISNLNNYTDINNINPNYIEQLRPLIFGLGADYNKNGFLDALEEKMVEVFKSIQVSEKKMAVELRRGDVITKKRLDNSVIAYADENILSVFNRKFLNKVYNDENPGFTLTLDSIMKNKVSGSFRSLYNISDILKNKSILEKQLKIKIETPGHEKAAGFIIKSNNPEKNPIDESTIEAINVFINNSIEKIKENEVINTKDYLLTDLSAIQLIDRINKVVRGNVSNFEKITPILSLNKDTIWTDSYTTEQFTMQEVIDSKKYGYITINTDFNSGTIIIPVELIRRLVENNYKDYLSLGYMDEGVFMVDRLVPSKQAKKIIDIRGKNSKTKALIDAWELDFKEKNYVNLNRSEIADNPFFKYHDFGQLNFELFEKMIIGIIDSNKIDTLAVFDVEANGFGNSKLMNIGSTNYTINEKSGEIVNKDEFFQNLYRTSRKEDYLLTNKEISELIEIDEKEVSESNMAIKKVILQKHDSEFGVRYFIPKDAEKISRKKMLPYKQIKNYVLSQDDKIIYNREIQAVMLAFLVKDKDFLVPQEMINLTGITQEVLEKYGKETKQVDQELLEFYKDKKVLFGAHNTPYDARVVRANLPKTYEILKNNKIYDSALFAKEEMLAYDSILVSKIKQVEEIREGIVFYNNEISDFNLNKFIKEDKNGYFPDRNNEYLLEIDNGNYYLVDKLQHEKIKINTTKEELIEQITSVSIPINKVKYSVEKLAEQWMIHSLLLSDENFNIKLVDLSKPKYIEVKEEEDALKFFQENYHFDISIESNINNFKNRYTTTNLDIKKLKELTQEFLELNKDIAQKFSDAWIYKMVLEIKDPSAKEINNDLISLVNYQTNVPEEKIRKIFSEALAFKSKYHIDHIIQHEMHANGPWRTDIKGDIAFEDKLTLCLLANKEYNSYSHDITNALNKFNVFQIKAKLIFDMADGLSDYVAQDSYSFRQGILYDRENMTPMIKNIKERESLLSKTGRHIVKYKLGSDILPPKTAIYAIVKENVRIDRKDIEKHKEQLTFIMLNEQLINSLHNAKDSQVQIILNKVYQSNYERLLEYKSNLEKYYDYVEYNKKDYYVKEFLDNAIKIGIEGKIPKNLTKPLKDTKKKETKKEILSTTDMKTINNVQIIINNMMKSASELMVINEKNVDIVKKMIDERASLQKLTDIEIALINENINFNNNSTLNESAFLSVVDINRKSPIEKLLDHHQEYRLINGLVEENQNLSLNIKSKNKNKP